MLKQLKTLLKDVNTNDQIPILLGFLYQVPILLGFLWFIHGFWSFFEDILLPVEVPGVRTAPHGLSLGLCQNVRFVLLLGIWLKLGLRKGKSQLIGGSSMFIPWFTSIYKVSTSLLVISSHYHAEKCHLTQTVIWHMEMLIWLISVQPSNQSLMELASTAMNGGTAERGGLDLHGSDGGHRLLRWWQSGGSPMT